MVKMITFMLCICSDNFFKRQGERGERSKAELKTRNRGQCEMELGRHVGRQEGRKTSSPTPPLPVLRQLWVNPTMRTHLKKDAGHRRYPSSIHLRWEDRPRQSIQEHRLNSCSKCHQSNMAQKKEKIIRVIWWFQMCFPLERALKETKPRPIFPEWNLTTTCP